MRRLCVKCEHKEVWTIVGGDMVVGEVSCFAAPSAPTLAQGVWKLTGTHSSGYRDRTRTPQLNTSSFFLLWQTGALCTHALDVTGTVVSRRHAPHSSKRASRSRPRWSPRSRLDSKGSQAMARGEHEQPCAHHAQARARSGARGGCERARRPSRWTVCDTCRCAATC